LDQWFMKLRKIFDIFVDLGIVAGKDVASKAGGFLGAIGGTDFFNFQNVEAMVNTLAERILDTFEEAQQSARTFASVILRDVVIPIVQATTLLSNTLKDLGLIKGEGRSWFSGYLHNITGGDAAKIIQLMGSKPIDPNADSDFERMLRAASRNIDEQIGLHRPGTLAENFRNRRAETIRRANVSGWAADPRMSPFNPNRFAQQGPAQIPEGVLAPAYFQQDRAGKKLLGGMAGNELHEFNQRQKEISDARSFLQKQTRPALTMGRFGVFPQEAVKSTYEQIFDAELFQAFEKMEKAVGSNTKAQNAGASAMKGSQEAIAAIARSENTNRESPQDRFRRVMEEVKEKIKLDTEVSKLLIDAIKKNPGIVVKEP
jgi:hypothetical protein